MINWVLHAISLLAIIFLLVKRNSECCAPGPNGKASTTDSTMTNSSPGFPVAFFYSDSLLNNLGFVKENEKAMKKKQDAIVNELKAKETSFQKEVQSLQENAQNMTRKEMEATQERLGKMEQELMMRKEKLSAQFAEETGEFTEKLYGKITSYLKEINQDQKYKYVFSLAPGGNIFLADDALDLTPEMIKGLNEKYSTK